MVTKFLTDPMVAAILVVTAYSAAAAVAWLRANAARRMAESRSERRMLATSVTLLVLALSHQLEFIPEAIAMAKAVAKNQGWYAHRWLLAVVGVVILVGVLSLTFIYYRPNLQRLHPTHWLIAIGTAILAGYFLLRATSIHRVDPWLGIHFGCPRTNSWIQVIAALFIGFGLWRAPSFVSSHPQSAQSKVSGLKVGDSGNGV